MIENNDSINTDYLMGEYQEAFSEKGTAFEEEERFGKAEFLDEGGCKKLYTVYDNMTDRIVVKAIPKNDDPETIAGFVKEAKLLASLQHPNILPVYDVGVEDGTPFMLMKFLEGKSLEDLIKRKSLEEKLEIFGVICDAVAYAHSCEITHMDLKPANIKISGFGDITICDWGSAVTFNEENDSEVAATPGYMAPEAYNGEAGPLCDIYSLGCILFEMISGKKLYPQKNLQERIKANRKGNIKLDSIQNPSLRSICESCLEPDPRKRIDSATAIYLRIDLFNKKIPVPEENAGIFRRVKLFLKRRPALALSFALFMIVTAMLSLYSAFIFNNQKKIATTQKMIAEQKEQEASKLLKKYLEEKQQKDGLIKERGNMLYRQAQQAYQMYRHKEARELLDLSISAAEETPEKLELAGKLEIINFNPSAAKKIFDEIGKTADYKDYLKILPTREKLRKMSGREMETIIWKYRNHHTFFYHHLYGSIFTDPKIPDIEKETLLNRLASRFKCKEKINVLDGGKTLKFPSAASTYPVFLSNSLRLKKLDFSGCKSFPDKDRLRDFNLCYDLEEIDLSETSFDYFYTFKHLNIKRINLKNSKFKRVAHLQSFPLEEINLAGSNIKSLQPLLSMQTLKIVTVSQNMQKLPGFKELSDKVEIKFQ